MMKLDYRRFGNKIVLRIDKDEEILSKITELCKKENIRLAAVSGIGATSETELGIFNIQTKEYIKKTVTGLFEISALVGNISQMNGECYLHLHITIGNVEKNETYAGHLNRAVIGATSEIVIDIIDGEIDRQKDESIGINLIKF